MSKKIVVPSVVVVLVCLGFLIYLIAPQFQEHKAPIPQPLASITDKNTVAHTWQWEPFKTPGSSSSPSTEEVKDSVEEEVPYDVVGIYNALQEVRLSSDGEVILDNKAKGSLESAFINLGPELSPTAIAQLQELIRIGLPGLAGEQTAQILGDYYAYRLAETDMLSQVDSKSIQNARESYDQVAELRRYYLGHDVAEQLFAEEEVHALHTMNIMELMQNPDLTDEEKLAKRGEMQAEFELKLAAIHGNEAEVKMEQTVNQMREEGASEGDIYQARANLVGIEQADALAAADREQAKWEQRYQQFAIEKQQILAANLSEEEQQSQLDQLLHRYFEESEFSKVQNYEWAQNEKSN